MISLLVQQIIILTLFLFASVILFTFPGFGIIKVLKIKVTERLALYTLSTVLGLTVFTLVIYALSLLHLKNLILLLMLFGVIAAIKSIPEISLVVNSLKEKLFSLLTLVLILGVLFMTSINAVSGLKFPGGIMFWSAHGHDGIWHVALIEQMIKESFPFSNPEYANHSIQNYHFFIDLLISEISRLLHFSVFDLYFRLMPALLALLTGVSSYIFVKRWSGSNLAGLWSMVFIFFLGNFGYIVTLLKNRSLNGESVFWIPQLFSVQGNPPQAAAVVILTSLTYCILAFLRDREKRYFLPIIIFASAIVEFKVYAGVVVLGALLLIGVYELLLKRNFWSLGLFLATLVPAALISLPNSSKIGDYLIFEPWWFIRTMVVAPDKLDWMNLELSRQTYLSEGNIKRVIQLEMTAFAIFFLGNLGMRIIGLIQGLKMLFLKKIFRDSFDLYFLTMILISLFLPMIFLQKGVAYNIIQISQYSLLLLGFLSARTLGEVFERIRKKWVLMLLSFTVLVMGIPTQLGLLWGFYSNPPNAIISSEQIIGLNFLKNHSLDSDIILTYPHNKYRKDKYIGLPLPINVWSDTGYVPAISSRKTLISDKEQLLIMGYEIDSLFDEREKAFQSQDPRIMNDFLRKYKISYIYLEKEEGFASDSIKLNINLIYNNNDIKIYQVKS